MNGMVDIRTLDHVTRHYPGLRLRRAFVAVAVALLTAAGVALMYRVLSTNGVQPLEMVVLGLFAVTFAWVAAAFTSAMIGVVLTALKLDPLTLRRHPADATGDTPLRTRTAIVMPVYNEDVDRVMRGLEATFRDLGRTGRADAFDFFLLSDTTDDAIAAEERRALARLIARLDTTECGLYYRRRDRNEGRKAGNIADFCERWGHYHHMIVLDADSIMAGDTLVRLAVAMQTNPDVGIIQTVPIPVRQHSPFGRAVQFASTLYSALLAAGQSFWQADTMNYWGHNAIIRVAPFREHCKLPVLPGDPPLGGEILSHDFVEAALMRRAGWDVLLMPELGGSYEEVPGNVLDFAKRDRRWSEGNIQHLRLLTMPGLHTLSRLHFLLGAFAYCCSFLWLLMLAVSSVDAVARALTDASYFGPTPTLFPDWPVTRTAEMWSLLGMVVAMLLLPKILGVMLCLFDPERRRGFGGAGRLCLSAAVEMVLSVVIAPILMCFHSRFVVSILMGRRAAWNAQNREGRQLSWSESVRNTATLTLCGVVWGVVIYFITPIFFLALTPVLFGLVFAAPLVAWSSHNGLGRRLERWGIFATPAEVEPDPVLRAMEQQGPTLIRLVLPDAPLRPRPSLVPAKGR